MTKTRTTTKPGAASLAVAVAVAAASAASSCGGPLEGEGEGDLDVTTVQGAVQSSWLWPLAGTINRDWVVNNYVDLDPNFGLWRDYRGGDRTYDGHAGIDIDVSSFRASDAGVAVRAVTAATVMGIEESQPDRNLSCVSDAWNFVWTRTADGHDVTYGHLKKDSVVVNVGQAVAQGTVLAMVGSSGCSSQPHLHLETTDPGHFLLEPFQAGYWGAPPAYDGALALMDVVVADMYMARKDYFDPRPNVATLAQGSPLSVAVHVGGGLAGNSVLVRVRRPDGSVFATQTAPVSGALRHGVFFWNWTLDAAAPLGTWTVQVEMNGALARTHTFTVVAGRVFADDFSDGNSTGWITSGGTWSVGQGDALTGDVNYRSFRQTGTGTGTARARATSVAAFTDQVASARVKVIAFNAATGSVALLGRALDNSNYYQAALVSTGGAGSAQIGKVVGGAATTLASAPFPVATDTVYDLRLELAGSALRFFVNGAQIATATDGSLASGTIGVATTAARAELGQIRSGTPTASAPPPGGGTLFSDDFEAGNTSKWSLLSGSWSVVTDGTRVLRQSATTDNARAATSSAAWTDQKVSARVKPLTWNGSDRFAAVLARLQDANNYYYATLRSSGKLELKKLVGGTSTTLATKAFTVATNTWYTVRLDVVGSALALFVNGTQQLTATDTRFTSGKAGVATFFATASFDDVTVTAP